MLEPPLRLVICGAGHDAIPLVRAAAGIGWRPVVVDDRPAFLTTERYPEAHAFVGVDEPVQIADAAPLDERTFVVVMTHNFLRDRDYLRGLLRSDVGYIAMLGPAARTQRILMDLAETASRSPTRTGRASTAPQVSTWAPRDPTRSPTPSWLRSSRYATSAPAGSSRSAPARSTTAPAPAPKRADRSRLATC